MSSGRKGDGVRSITYPSNDSSTRRNRARFCLTRMNSFDCSYEDAEVREERPSREKSLEGRLRTRHFHSASSSNPAVPGQKCLRFSDECWCGPAIEQYKGILSKSRQRQQFGLRSSSSSSRSSSSSSSSGSSGSSSSSVSPSISSSSSGSSTYTSCSCHSNNSTERLIGCQREVTDRINRKSSISQSPSPRHKPSNTRRSGRSLSLAERRQLCSSSSLPTSADTESTTSRPSNASTNASSEGRRRRSQFRRAWSLFSLTCDKEVERERREKSPQQKILRPPTRYYYRRGVSGLPIECSSTYVGLAY
ncbi:putative protein TPRXL [Eriocheir sinensis]|uniref:putative protein TPRXL n=1 Tax=Eriocheir sinensis TaxID=95602 RepID=UPI0021C5DBA7|nr:putative protein TPRXL [Eriocheir sinensis]